MRHVPAYTILMIALLASLALMAGSHGAHSPEVVLGQPEIKEITFEPAQDTYVATAIEVALGKRGNLRAGYWKGAEFLTYIQFEFPPELGEDADIVSAELAFYCHESSHEYEQPTAMEFRTVTQDWDEDEVLFKRRPRVAGPKIRWNVPRCNEPDDTDHDPGWRTTASIEEDITDLVKRWYSGDVENNGWELGGTKAEPEHRYTFYARDGEAPLPLGRRPKLTIRWRGGVTPTFTPSNTPTATNSPTPTITPSPTNTLTPTNTSTITPTPEHTATPTPTDTPEPPEGIFLPVTLKLVELVDSAPPAEPTAEETPEATDVATEEPTPQDTAEPTPEPDVEIELEGYGPGGGKTGTVALWQVGEDVAIALGLTPSSPTDDHPSSVYEGQCGDLGEVAYELENVVDGHADTLLTDTMLSELADGAHAIAATESADDSTVISCGNLPES